MNEDMINVRGGELYYRHTVLKDDRETLLFLHGLGESGLCFMEAFQQSELNQFNILVPDMLGYGKSSEASGNDYSFSAQILRLFDLLDRIGIKTFHLIGHSMGGDIGTLFCRKANSRVQSFINIEGNLTPDDRFITTNAIAAEEEHRFKAWFHEDFCKGMVRDWSRKWPSCIRYLESLSMCSLEAFLQNAVEIYELNNLMPESDYGRIGLDFEKINIPKIYCWGMESLSDSSREFLKDKNIPNRMFEQAFHWLMLDQTEVFYTFLGKFLEVVSKPDLS